MPCWPLRQEASKSQAKSAAPRAIDGAHVRGALSRGAHTCVSKRTKRKTWEDGLWDHTVEVGDLNNNNFKPPQRS